MVDWLAVATYLVAMIAIGFCAIHLVLRRAGEEFAAELWLPASWAAGLMLQAITYHLTMLALGRIVFLPAFVVAGALVVAAFINERRATTPFPFAGFSFLRPEGPGGARTFQWVAAVLVLLLFGIIYSNAASYPFTGYDGRTIWNFKAKVLFLDRTVLDHPAFTDPYRVQYHRDYPLLMPYGSFSMMAATDSLNDRNVRFLFSTFLIQIVLFSYAIVRRMGGSALLAAFVALMYCSTPFRNDWGEVDGGALNAGATDIPLSLYALLSVSLYLLAWREGKRWQWLLAAIFGAGTLMLKKEGIVIFCATMCGHAAYLLFGFVESRRRALLRVAGCAALTLAIATPWFLVARHLPNLYDEDYAARMTPDVLLKSFERLPMITYNVALDVSNFAKWNAYWVVLPIVIIAAAFGWRKRRDFFLDAVIVSWIGAYLFTYMVTPLNLNFHLNTSTSRLLSHLLPLVLLRFALFHHDRNPLRPADAPTSTTLPAPAGAHA